MGAAGTVIIFVCTLAYLAIVTPFVLAYAAHSYLVVMQDTSAGLDRVHWPAEPVQDWLPGAAYLGGLAAIWLAPAGILSAILRHDVFIDDPALRFFAIAVPGMWLLFPLGLLSSLSAVSRWTAFRPAILLRLVRILPSLLGFYLLTSLLLAAAATLWKLGLFAPAFWLLPAASVVGGAAVLIHARLLGRIAWLLQQLEGKTEKVAPVKKAAPPVVVKAKRRTKTRGVKAHDPWAQPEPPAGPNADAPSLPVEGYGLAVEPAPARKPERAKRPEKVELPVEGYEVAEEVGVAPPATPAADPAKAESIARELALRERSPTDAPPAWPLFSGVWTFPFYESSLKAWLGMALGGVAVGVGVRGLVGTWPF